ncbi:MAG: hypothetical protein ACN4EH_00250 [Methyloceanibacter sp.]
MGGIDHPITGVAIGAMAGGNLGKMFGADLDDRERQHARHRHHYRCGRRRRRRRCDRR